MWFVEFVLFAILVVVVAAVFLARRTVREMAFRLERIDMRLHAVYMKLDNPDKHYCVVVGPDGYEVEEQ